MFAFLYSAPMITIYIFTLSSCYMHFRGKVRYKFLRQFTDHSTFLAPVNAIMYLFSAVPSTPFLDPETFPETKILEDNWQVIRDEGLTLLSGGAVKASDKLDDIGFNSFFRRGWTRFYVKWYGDSHPSARKFCPKTIELLQKVPSIKAAMFTYLPPGGELFRHRDPFAGSLRYHLGLSIPKDSANCQMIVDGETRCWEEGKPMMFDETYIHTANNQTEEGRLILLCDIERPMHFMIPRFINRLFAKIIMRASLSPNDLGDKTGGINKIFGKIYVIRLIGKKIKAKNRPIYYAIKYLVFGGLFYMLLFSWYVIK